MPSIEAHALAGASASESALDQMLQGDPLARWLLRWRVPPAGLAAIVMAYGAFHALLVPLAYGLLRSRGGVLGALDDWPYIVMAVGVVPLLASYYAWQPATIQAVYAGIASRFAGDAAAARRTAELARPFGWGGWAWLALAIAAVQVLSWIYDLSRVTVPNWLALNPVTIGTAQPIRFVSFYFVVYVLGRQIVTLFGLNRFFAQFSVDIAPVHPDRAGGLRVLGDYVLSSGLLLAILGSIFGMTFLRSWTNPGVLTPEFYLELVTYCLLAPILFFVPLWSVHKRMVAARQRLLVEIAEQFDQEYRALFDNLRRNVLAPEAVTHLEAVQKIYHIADAAPVWPFDLQTLSKFGAVVFLPILVPLGVDLLAGLLTR